MTDKEFEEKLLHLAFLVGEDGAEDAFAEEYEALLYAIKALSGPRYEKFARLKKVLLLQAQYLMNEWLKAKKEAGCVPTAGNA